MSKSFAAAAWTLLVAGCTIPGPAPSPPPPAAPGTAVLGATETRIFRLINAERKRQGLPALAYSSRLDRMARIQSQNMAYFHKMAHTLPGASLPTLGSRAMYAGYPFGRLTENVAESYPSAESVVQAWMNSSGHRHNILDADVVETGIAISRSDAGGIYYCQVFGKLLESL
ncbi:MAG: CAP domain-containing protein [Gemmatimonadales bacterium]